jgi:sugar-specific transcriptional regulator TrmB
VKILEELGLTSVQARTYMALCRLSIASDAKTISASANIVRQDIYHTLTELERLSLVETVIEKPVLYRAIPIMQVVTILAERRKTKTDALLDEARELLLPYEMDERIHLEGKHQFTLIPKKETCVQRIKETIQDTKISLVIVAPWREMTQCLFTLHESINHALKRGVEIRCLSQEQYESNATISISELSNYPNFKLRFSPDLSEVRFWVFDNQAACIAIMASYDAVQSPALWTNNYAILHLLRHYIGTKWATAKDFCL